jgi:tetratricopeptide (TPR) repeat protein
LGKIGLLYYYAGYLSNAEMYSKKAQKNIVKLINNDNENYLFKEDLLWSYLLSVQVFINQKKLDKALIYLKSAKVLIDKANNSKAKTSDLIRANIYLLQQQARTLALLKQNQSALLAITEALQLFKEHLQISIDTSFYARIMLTKLSIQKTWLNIDNTSIESELREVKELLESTLKSNPTNFETLSIYLTTLKFMQQLQIDNHLPLSNDWLELYQNSDYNIPDYSIISSMDIQ